MAIAPATLDIPKNPAIRRAWIGFQLRIRGLSYRELARREGVSHQAFSQAALGGGSQYLQETLAHALDLRPQALFPELYDAGGRRLGRTRDPKRTTRREDAPVKNTKVA
jgi:lambda repressor-like predicted transcriptional regulator